MKISVYIPSYNQKRFLVEAIKSVLNQTRRPDQVIVVDDGSSDGTPEMIRGYASRFPDLFTPIFHERNRGVARTRIDALSAVRHELVTYIDGDDRMGLRKLETESQTLADTPSAGFVFSNYCYMTADGSRRTRVWIKDQRPPEGDIFLETVTRDFPDGNLFHNELLPIRCLRDVGFHDTSFSTYEDFDLRIRLTRKYRGVYCPEINVEVREHDGPRLSKSRCHVHLANLKKIFRKNQHLWADMPADDRERIRKGIDAYLGTLALISARELVREGRRREAWAAWREAFRCGAGRRELMSYLIDANVPEWAEDTLLLYAKRLGRLIARRGRSADACSGPAGSSAEGSGQ